VFISAKEEVGWFDVSMNDVVPVHMSHRIELERIIIQVGVKAEEKKGTIWHVIVAMLLRTVDGDSSLEILETGGPSTCIPMYSSY
jgi:hypothetical protein